VGTLHVPRVRLGSSTASEIGPISTGLLGDWLDAGVVRVVDIRPPQQYADAHIPGSIAIPVCRRWAEWCAALVPAGLPVVLIAHEHRDVEHACTLARSVEGLELAGYLHAPDSPGSAMDAWICRGGAYDELPTMRIAEVRHRLDRDRATAASAGATECCSGPRIDGLPLILDVRDEHERQAVRIEPSAHVPLGSLLDRADQLPQDTPIATLCRSGVRSMIAASALRRLGFDAVVSIEQGMDRWTGEHPGDPWLRTGTP
jgi:hydroxyacylglutathione hydrolase